MPLGTPEARHAAVRDKTARESNKHFRQHSIMSNQVHSQTYQVIIVVTYWNGKRNIHCLWFL